MKRASSTHAVRWLISFATLAILIGALLYERRAPKPAFPSETEAGLELLSRRFVGPGYFHVDSDLTNHFRGEAHHRYYINVTDAESQVERVIGERKLPGNRSRDLERLIQKLAEPSKSRLVGETEVNVLRLNLVLDSELKKQ